MQKADVIAAIIAALTDQRDHAAAAADQARETATSKENIAENKYDTFGLEAAYLAHGQSTRVQQLTAEIAAFSAMLRRTEEVGAGVFENLVLLQKYFENGERLSAVAAAFWRGGDRDGSDRRRARTRGK